ncbi:MULTISPECIES: hypothetical protein [unclassified Variovorax]|uniref:hypothetical protein n=1 Tax=unclassified Variovorax TaxID=663243 RepID=UPI003F468025
MQRRPAWHVLAALVALGQHRSNGNANVPFSEVDLASWVPTYPRASYARLAIDRLVLREEAERLEEKTVRMSCVRPVLYWRLTETGVATARAAYTADRALNPAAHGALPAVPVDPLAQRLWSLLRIRRALTADEAAASLTDAGEDIAAARSQFGAILLAWSRRYPSELQVSKKRIDGFKRYVLLDDLGSTPPAFRVQKAKKATTA